VDGASDLWIYWVVIMPMIRPAVATIAILTFQATWNNTEASTLFINSENLKTFAFYLTTLTSTSTTGANAVAGRGLAAAAALIMFLPNLLIFILLQSQVMSTMSHSGLKG
jgi:ABC-type glycerol-3-phosphate transport system permease component